MTYALLVQTFNLCTSYLLISTPYFNVITGYCTVHRCLAFVCLSSEYLSNGQSFSHIVDTKMTLTACTCITCKNRPEWHTVGLAKPGYIPPTSRALAFLSNTVGMCPTQNGHVVRGGSGAAAAYARLLRSRLPFCFPGCVVFFSPTANRTTALWPVANSVCHD